MKLNKLSAIFMTAVLVAGMFGACAEKTEPDTQPVESSQQQSSVASEASSEQSETPENIESVKLEVWYALSGNSGEKFVEISDKYQSDNISIELSFSGTPAETATKVSAALLSGTQPDVALMYAGPLYTGVRGNYTMETLIEDPDFNKADVYDGLWEYTKYQDRVCALPYASSMQMVYYNKTALDEAGIDMSTPPKTWDELYAMVEKFMAHNKDKPEISGFDVSDTPWLFKSMIMQKKGEIIAEENGVIVPRYNNSTAVSIGDFWQKLVTNGYMVPGEHDNAENKFLAGNMSFIAASSIRISRWTELEFELGAFQLPAFDEQSAAIGGAVLVILTEDQARVDASWDYIKHLTSVENATEFSIGTGYMPFRKSSLEQPAMQQLMESNAMFAEAFEQLNNAWAYTHFDQMGTMDGFLKGAIEKIEQGEDVQASLDYAAQELLDEIDA